MTMADLNYSQQNVLFDPMYARPVNVLGAGSVSSYLSPLLVGYMLKALVKEGCPSITVWDGDDVESHNVPIADFGIGDLATYKVHALAANIETQTGFKLDVRPTMYAGEPLVGNVICCVDDMDARKRIWERVRGGVDRPNPNVGIFLDTRVHRSLIEVFVFDPLDDRCAKEYAKYLYGRSEVMLPMCGTHGLPDIAMMTAAVAMRLLREAWTGVRKSRHHSVFPDLTTADDPAFE